MLPVRAATLLLVGLVRIYQYGISPMTPAHCRFAPTCSSYAVEAIVCHGPLKGCWLAARRLLRCHPWGGSGFDPVPGEPKARTSHGTSLDHAGHGK